jgi:hypothetical protein
LAKKNPKITYNIDNTDIPIVASQVDLGVTVTQDISWTEQTNKAARKAVGTLYLLKKIFPSPSHSLGVIYIAPIYDLKWTFHAAGRCRRFCMIQNPPGTLNFRPTTYKSDLG